MGKVLKTAKGINGDLELLENKIRIKRKGLMSGLRHKGDKEILIKHITSIYFKNAGYITAGYIRFAFMGGQEYKGSFSAAEKDENAITFGPTQKSDFEEIKSMIETRMAEPERKEAAGSGINDLDKLAELKEKGIISEEEFNAKKRQILGL